jgi:hypothetical protein
MIPSLEHDAAEEGQRCRPLARTASPVQTFGVEDDWSDTWDWTPEQEKRVLRGMSGCGWFVFALATVAVALVVALALFGSAFLDMLSHQE